MNIDIHAKSADLLEQLANSVYDRDPKNPEPLFFSITEIHIVEKWLKETIKESEERPNKHEPLFLTD